MPADYGFTRFSAEGAVSEKIKLQSLSVEYRYKMFRVPFRIGS